MPCPAVGRLLSPRQGWASPTTASTVRGYEIAVFPTDGTFITILSLERFRVNVFEERLRTAGLTDQAARARREEFYADRVRRADRRHEHPFMPLSVHPILSMNRDVA